MIVELHPEAYKRQDDASTFKRQDDVSTLAILLLGLLRFATKSKGGGGENSQSFAYKKGYRSSPLYMLLKYRSSVSELSEAP